MKFICLVVSLVLILTGCSQSVYKSELQLDIEPFSIDKDTRQVIDTHYPVPYIIFGRSHTLYIDEFGTLWGKGVLGEYKEGEIVQNGHFQDWVRIAEDVVLARAGDLTSVFIKKDGSLWMFGDNTPYKQPELIDRNIDDILSVSSGGCYVLTYEGEIWSYRSQSVIDTKNLIVEGLKLEKTTILTDVFNVFFGYQVVFYIQKDGSLWGSGMNSTGTLGMGRTSGVQSQPVKIMDNVRWVHSHGGSTFAVTWDNALYGWGSNNFGQLGIPSSDPVVSPIKIMDNVLSAYMYSGTAFVIYKDNSLWTFGRHVNESVRDKSEQHHPVKLLDDIYELYVFNIASGSAFNGIYALKSDGTLYGWGNRDYFTGTGSVDLIPGVISDDVAYFFHINLNNDRPSYIKNDGTIWSFGLNTNYVRADYSTTTRRSYTPTQISYINQPMEVPLPVNESE